MMPCALTLIDKVSTVWIEAQSNVKCKDELWPHVLQNASLFKEKQIIEIMLTLRLLMSIYIYIYGAPILDVSRSYTTTHHSR